MDTLIAQIDGNEVHVYRVNLAEIQHHAGGSMYLPAVGVAPPAPLKPPYFAAASTPEINISGAGYDDVIAKVRAGERALAVALGQVKDGTAPTTSAPPPQKSKPDWDPY